MTEAGTGYNPAKEIMFQSDDKTYREHNQIVNSINVNTVITGGVQLAQDIAANQAQQAQVEQGVGNKGTGETNSTNGSGLGKFENTKIIASEKGLNKIKEHIANNGFETTENTQMIERIENALKNGEKLSGADASFYMHEIKESSLMSQGYTYEQAHKITLETYQVSPFSVYHPDIIQKDPQSWGKPWFDFWGIEKE